jgi:type IV secretory pathway component VirB8
MTEELKKINLDTAGFTSQPMQKATKSGKTTLIILASVLGVFVLLIGGLILALMPLKAVAAQAQVVVKSAKQTATYVKDQDLTKMKEGLVTTRKDMDAHF